MGSVGQSLPGVPLCGQQTGVKRRDTPELGSLNSLEANEENKCKTNLAGKHTAQGLRWGPQLDSLNKQRQPWMLQKSHPPPLPLGRNGCLDRGPNSSSRWDGGGGAGFPLPGKKEQHLGSAAGGVSSWSPFSPPRAERGHRQIPVLGAGEGCLPKPRRGHLGTQDGTRAPCGGRQVGSGEERYQQHRSHSEHTPGGRVGGQGGNQNKARSCALGSQVPRAAG